MRSGNETLKQAKILAVETQNAAKSTDVNLLLFGSCKNLLTSQRDTIESLLDNTTQRQNLGVVSIYTTKLGKKSYQTVGAFGNFLTLPPSSENPQK